MITRKYFWLTLYWDVKTYIKGYDVYWALKAVWHKPYWNLQSLPMPIYSWKNRFINFVTGFSLSVNQNRNSYNWILVIVDYLTIMVHYKLYKTTINITGLAKVIITIVVGHHGLSKLIISDEDFWFISNFWFLRCQFLSIKQKLSITFILK